MVEADIALLFYTLQSLLIYYSLVSGLNKELRDKQKNECRRTKSEVKMTLFKFCICLKLKKLNSSKGYQKLGW